jgi:hypothetical protein
METLILQALARGYCSNRNKKKVLDPDLIEDMAKEVMDVINHGNLFTSVDTSKPNTVEVKF